MQTASTGLFITGTDTGIGKTFVCRLLAEILAQQFPVTYFKPVQTGGAARETAPDFAAVRSSGVFKIIDEDDHVPYVFADACSPHLAARRAGASISIRLIEEKFRRLEASGAFIIAEGAGGILVPVNDREYMLDIMARLALPVLLVASPRLGTLNHTLLSVRALLDARLSLAGVVFNNAAGLPRDFIYYDNLATLREKLSPVAVMELDYGANGRLSLEEFCREIAQRRVS